MDHNTYSSKLQQLELQRVTEGQLADIRRSDALTTDQQELETGYFYSVKVIGSVASISLSTTASYWAFSPAAAVLTVINADIGPADNASLFPVIWSTCAAITVLLFGRISDKFGRRWFVIGASCLSFIGGIVACTAKDMDTLTGANVLLGLGAGVHTCYALTVGEICPNKYKFFGVALCVISSVITTGFGAYLGIMLTHTANWRWIYYIFLILMFFAIVLQVFYYRPPNFRQLHGNDRTRMEEVKRIDFVGIILLVTGLTLFLLGISWGGSPLPWSSPRILGLVITGGALIVAFVFWEIYSTVPNPLVPMHFFKDVRGFVCLVIIGSVSGVMYVALSIIWPSQVARIYGAQASSWQANAWLSTTIAFGIWGGIVILGPLVGIIKHLRIQMIIMMAVSTAFLGGLSTCNSSNFGQSAAFSFLACFPAGILEVIPALLVQMDANDADNGTVFSIVGTMRSAVGAVMAAVFVAILTNKVPAKIAEFVPVAAVNGGLPESSLTELFAAINIGTDTAFSAVPGITPEIEVAVGAALSDAYAAAYAYVYYAAVAVGVVGLIACIYVRDYDALFTGHVPRKIYASGESETPNLKIDGASQEKIALDTAEKVVVCETA